MFSPGERVGYGERFIIEKQLGAGGFGLTYKAFDTVLSCTCVLKLLRHEVLLEEGVDTRSAETLLQREAQRLLKLNHVQIPNFLGLYIHSDADGYQRFLLAQEFIEGLTLREFFQRHGSKEFAFRFFEESLALLHYLHSFTNEQGEQTPVLHLDIKPDNFLIRNSDQRLFLIDFGLAIQLRSQAVRTGQTVFSIGGSGTPGYMPPEQGQGRPGPESDIYALAITFLELLSGRNATELSILVEEETPLNTLLSLSQEQARLLAEMTRYSPRKRLKKALSIVQRWQAIRKATKRQASSPESRRVLKPAPKAPQRPSSRKNVEKAVPKPPSKRTESQKTKNKVLPKQALPRKKIETPTPVAAPPVSVKSETDLRSTLVDYAEDDFLETQQLFDNSFSVFSDIKILWESVKARRVIQNTRMEWEHSIYDVNPLALFVEKNKKLIILGSILGVIFIVLLFWGIAVYRSIL